MPTGEWCIPGKPATAPAANFLETGGMNTRYILNCALLALVSVTSGCASLAPATSASPAGSVAAPAAVPAGGYPFESQDQKLFYQLLVAEMAWKREDTATAIAYYFDAAKTTGDAELAERTTRMAEFAQANDQAFAAARLWAELAPQSSDAHQFLGTLFVRSGEAENALQQYREVVRLEGQDKTQAYIRIGSQLSKESNQDAVLQVLERLTQEEQTNPYAFFTYAHVAARFSRLPLAQQQVDKALAIKPDWPEAIILKARVHQMSKDIDGAVAAFTKALSGPLKKDGNLRIAFGRLLMDAKRLEEAREQYVILANQDPDNMDVVYSAALLSLQVEKFKEGKEFLQKMIAAHAREDEAHFYLGQVAEKEKDTATAVKHYRKVDAGEYYLTAQMRIAALLARSGKTEDALAQVRRISTETEQERIQLFLLEGDIMVEAGRLPEAYDIYDQALRDMPENSNLLYARAIAAEKLNRLDVVERDLRKIIEQDPNNVQALNALGYTLADRTTRYDEAMEFIKRALALEPKDAAIIDSMGWVHYRMGRNQEALTYLKEAIDIVGDAEIAAHLGEVLWVSGNKQEAMKVWNRALQEAPENRQILEVMRRFGK